MARGPSSRDGGRRDRRRDRPSRRGGASGGGLSDFLENLFPNQESRRDRARARAGRPVSETPVRLTSETGAREDRAGKGTSSRWDTPRRKLNIWFIAGGVAFVMLLLVVVPVGLVFAWGNSLGGLEELRRQMDPGQTVTFAWRDGTPIIHTRPDLGRKVDVRALPGYIPLAFIATEDRDFYLHDGVNNISLLRAAIVDIRSGHGAQGGSTITQQLVKYAILRDFSRTPMRFLRTMFIARNIERDLRQYYPNKRDMKDQLLGFYLASLDFGTGSRPGNAIHGLELAALTYFGKTPDQLRPAEAAVLAGMINGPSIYNPGRHWDRARTRAQLVLHNMTVVPQGLNQADYQQALRELDHPAPCPAATLRSALYSLDYIQNAHLAPLPPPPGPGDFAREQVTVTTTLDPGAQEVAERVLRENMPADRPDLQVALVAMDGSGAIRALMGGRDYIQSPYNRAAGQIPRQIGSTYKAFIYLAAMEEGANPDDLCSNVPMTFSMPGARATFSPASHGGGAMLTLRDAFARSSNVTATRLGYTLGYDRVVAQAAAVGFNAAPARVASWPLVANGRVIDLAAAYASLANGGHRVSPRFIELPGAHDPLQDPPVLSPRTVAAMADLGLAVVNNPGGTGHNARISTLRFGGKTGTTNNQADAWFMAFGDNFVVAVWVGYDRPRPGHDNGGDLPARLARAFLEQQHLGWGAPSDRWPPAMPETEEGGGGVANVSGPSGINYCD